MQQPTMQHTAGSTGTNISQGNIRFMSPLHHPVLALDRSSNQLVKVIQLGDVEGHSKAAWVVDEQGKLDIRSAENLTVIDGQFTPPARETYRTLFSQVSNR